MEEKQEFQHSIPKRAVLKNYVPNNEQGLWVCKKNEGVNKKTIPIKKPKNSVSFGEINFYGHKKINEITKENIISPKKNIRVEDFFSEFIEKPLTPLFDKIINTETISDLDIDEIKLIKKYCYVQHIRTLKARNDIAEFVSTNEFKEICNSIPDFLKKDIVKKIKNKYSKKNHSSLCIETKTYEDFIIETNLNKKIVHLLVGDIDSHFLLPDSGIIWTLSPKYKEEVCYIPISPKIILYLSEKPKGNLDLHHPDILKEITYIEAEKEIYSDSKNELEKLYYKMKNKEITTF